VGDRVLSQLLVEMDGLQVLGCHCMARLRCRCMDVECRWGKWLHCMATATLQMHACSVPAEHMACGERAQGRGDVVVLAATNRPDAVDAALLRPGRFDCRLFVAPPADAAERACILRVLIRRTPLAPDVDLAALAGMTPG
jgi:SpoVK/Ycf46/Vps4 family AAA+-type ATPase